jgi:hypothetical protein
MLASTAEPVASKSLAGCRVQVAGRFRPHPAAAEWIRRLQER